MRNICGRVFQNTQTKEVKCFLYDSQKNYCYVVQDPSKRGYQQCAFKTSTMIAVIEEFLSNYNSIVTAIEFFVDDEELNQEIKKIIGQIKDNGACWEILKDKLSFLSKYDSIGIKKVSIKSQQGNGFLLNLYANGIFDATWDVYNLVATEICNVVSDLKQKEGTV